MPLPQAVADCWSPAERAVLAYTDALVLEVGEVSDGVFAALQEHLTDEQILKLTYITCLYEMHATMSRALRTEWDDRDEPIVEVAGDHTSLAPEVGVEPGRTAARNRFSCGSALELRRTAKEIGGWGPLRGRCLMPLMKPLRRGRARPTARMSGSGGAAPRT